MYTVGIGIIVIAVTWILQGQRSAIRRNGKRLPRPPGTLPFAGNGIWFLQPRHRLLEWFSQAERQTGFDTYEISVPSLPPGIVINDPKNVEHVLKNNDCFIKGDFFRVRSWDLFGNGIINADGELWRIQRKAGLRFFSNANLKRFIDEVLPPLLQEVEHTLDVVSDRREVIDLQATLLELTTRLMGNVAYDMDMPASLPFSKAFDFASGAIGDRFQNPFWKISEFIWGAPLRQAVSEVKDFGRTIVSKAVQSRSASGEKSFARSEASNSLQDNLINSLLDHIDDHQIVADSAMNYLSAGRDTTAQSLTWTFYALMRHPNIATNLYNELLAAFPHNPTHIALSFDDIASTRLPYTLAVFNETLRHYPPVPVELKECTTPTTFPDGTWLPAGSVVLWVPWAMSRSTHIWGDDADEYKPERWLRYGANEEKPTLLTKSAYEFPVFNGGSRACLGKKMAETLAVDVIANLVWKYEFEEVRTIGAGERESQNSLTLPMEGGLPCLVKKRALQNV